MTATVRVGALNLRAYPNRGREHVHKLAELVADEGCDLLLLQECVRSWLDVIRERTEMDGFHAHRIDPKVPARRFSPDGCAICFGPRLKPVRQWRIARERFSPEAVHAGIDDQLPEGFEPMPERLMYRYAGRSLLAEFELDGKHFVAGSFHATPGTR